MRLRDAVRDEGVWAVLILAVILAVVVVMLMMGCAPRHSQPDIEMGMDGTWRMLYGGRNYP